MKTSGYKIVRYSIILVLKIKKYIRNNLGNKLHCITCTINEYKAYSYSHMNETNDLKRVNLLNKNTIRVVRQGDHKLNSGQ